MPAEMTARASAEAPDRTAPTTGAGRSDPHSDLGRPPAIAPPAPVRRGRDGQPRKRRSSANLWRLRHYLLPFRARFIATVLCAAVGTGATIVVPLVTRAVIDGPVAASDRAGLWTLGR